MASCQCQGIEELFNQKTVSRDVRLYHKRGPDKTTRMMLDAIKTEGVRGMSLLDIGGGVGAVQHELLNAGVENAVDVDASHSYLLAARAEAKRRGLADRIHFIHGNFVEEAAQITPADIVTLDRVICCYDDMHNLVDLSAARARRMYGLVYPRDSWIIQLGLAIMNAFLRLQKNPYRAFVHSTRAVETLLSSHGLTRRFYRRTTFWQVAVYVR